MADGLGKAEQQILHEIVVKSSTRIDWFRNNVGCYNANPTCPVCGHARYPGGSRWIRYGVGGSGGADVLGIVRVSGQFIACEVKAPGKKPTESQLIFLQRVEWSGGVALWADSAEKVCKI